MIKFSLTIPPNIAEAVSEQLGSEVEAFWWDNENRAEGMIQQDCKESFEAYLQAILASFKHESTITFTPLENRNWLNENQETLSPIEMDPFFIYGPHYLGEIPSSKFSLNIQSATAFGSGHHPTTASCLQALIDLSSSISVHTALDMGCGSGILSLAIAKLWNCKVISVDSDKKCVDTTQKNGYSNQVNSIQVYESVGFENQFIQREGPFDLIVANLHLLPLLELSLSFAAHASPDSILILSGILDTQEERLLEKFTELQFSPLKLYRKESWTTYILARASDPNCYPKPQLDFI